MFEDGSQCMADLYERGPDGFVIARWVEHDATLVLDLPNRCCEKGALKLQAVAKPSAPTMRTKPVCKRPAAKAPEDEESDEKVKEEDEKEEDKFLDNLVFDLAKEEAEGGEGEGEEDEGEEEERVEDTTTEPTTLCRFRVAPGHGTKMTVIVKSTGSDKAQLLEITSHACQGSTHTHTAPLASTSPTPCRQTLHT